eukprot:312706-Rhodomonas_salina.1
MERERVRDESGMRQEAGRAGRQGDRDKEETFGLCEMERWEGVGVGLGGRGRGAGGEGGPQSNGWHVAQVRGQGFGGKRGLTRA